MQVSDATPFYCPFHIHIDPMERLLLINFEKDPDSIYIGFEPQIFDDPVHGKGMLVIGWRQNMKVDVYHEPGLLLQKETYDIAGAGAEAIVETTFEHSHFEVTNAGVSARIRFTDRSGRIVDISIEENNRRQRKPFGLLAPMGEAAQNPPALPLVYLHDFYFVRRRHTNFSVRINGQSHQPDKLPMPIDWMRMYFTRYSPDPVIATLNPTSSGPLNPIPDNLTADNGVYRLEYKLLHSDGERVLESLSANYRHHHVVLEFTPAFPDLMKMVEGDRYFGQFKIIAHESTGYIAGEYSIRYHSGKASIQMLPSAGWKPISKKLSLRFLYRVAKVFRNWPKSYVWAAEIDMNEPIPVMKSMWQNNNTSP